MRWQLIKADAAAPAVGQPDDAWLDSILIDELAGGLGMTYLNDVAVFYDERDIRHGYDFKIEGSCFKGRYGLEYKTIRIILEDTDAPTGLIEHLTSIWGPQGTLIDEGFRPRLTRIA